MIVYQSKELINFGDSTADTDSRSLFLFLAIAEYGILGDLLAFLTQSPADFYDTSRND